MYLKVFLFFVNWVCSNFILLFIVFIDDYFLIVWCGNWLVNNKNKFNI